MTALRILRAGPACTVQDGGRHGYLRYGVTPAGPMDWLSHAMANTILGNPPNAAAIEVGPAGLSFTTT
ncbi:MAG: allophanate hydrolase, partial [Paracoccaceae bacterium]